MFFLGDVHNRFDHILPSVLPHLEAGRENHVIFLGDIQCERPFEERIEPLLAAGLGVWFIHGNHDTDKQEEWDNLAASAHRNLHARVVEIDGVRVAGLGGVFRGAIWHPDIHKPHTDESYDGRRFPGHWSWDDYQRMLQRQRKDKRAPVTSKQDGRLRKHLSSIFPQDYVTLMNQRADILVTHEAPSCHPFGFEEIERVARAMGASKVFHGHQHDCLDYSGWESRFRVEAFGVGLRGITDLDGMKVLDGETDFSPKVWNRPRSVEG